MHDDPLYANTTFNCRHYLLIKTRIYEHTPPGLQYQGLSQSDISYIENVQSDEHGDEADSRDHS